MGTKFAPSTSILFMVELEGKKQALFIVGVYWRRIFLLGT